MKKKVYLLILALFIILTSGTSVSAMHIMEGYLPPGYALFWFVVFIPFFLYGLKQLKKALAETPVIYF